MNIADELCRTFCKGIEVHSVPAGLAVGTPLVRPDGDRIGFYLVRGEAGSWRIEDDGFTVPLLIGSGVDIQEGERAVQFEQMLEMAGATCDDGELRTNWLAENAIPDAALRFTSMLLRLCDLAMLHPDRVRRTFKEDALAAIRKTFEGLAEIEEDAPVAARLSDFKADAVLRHVGFPPLAVFVGTSDNRIYEAILTRQIAKLNSIPVRVAAILESEKPPSVSLKVQQRARNYLDASPSFAGDPEGAMNRLLETSGIEVAPSAH
jgi:hypothetical protein